MTLSVSVCIMNVNFMCGFILDIGSYVNFEHENKSELMCNLNFYCRCFFFVYPLLNRSFKLILMEDGDFFCYVGIRW